MRFDKVFINRENDNHDGLIESETKYDYCCKKYLSSNEYVINGDYIEIDDKIIENIYEKYKDILKDSTYYCQLRINDHACMMWPKDVIGSFLDIFGDYAVVLSVSDWIIKGIIE